MARKTVTNSPSRTASPLDGVVADPMAFGPEDALSSMAGRERRLHARAYHHWVSLLGDARFPSIRALDPESIADFAANSILLDFRGNRGDPVIAYIGSALREECGMSGRVEHIAELPERSLLARLTGHCDQILTGQAPAGFEAEFVNVRGHTTLYRVILLPYSSDGLMIDFVHGVVSWKEVADPLLQASLDSALLEAIGIANDSSPAPTADPWPKGPASPDHPPTRSAAPLAQVAWATGAAPGTPVVLVGHVADEEHVAVTGSVVGHSALADRVLRASQ